MLELNIQNETSTLKAVILGTAVSNGPTPSAEDAYDPKSLEHILAGTYPVEEDMVAEMEALHAIFLKYGVTVYRPTIVEDENQIFTRDIAFVINDYFIRANILPEREKEFPAIQSIVDMMNPNKVIVPPEKVHIEGGDVMLWKNYVFIGTYKGADYSKIKTARTNMHGVNFIKELFPEKIIKEFDLVKSFDDPKGNALHFYIVSGIGFLGAGVIFKEGFRDEKDYQYLIDLFGMENLFHITGDEMYNMFSNVFSITPTVVVTERNFTRLNNWLEENNFTVETVPYAEIAKQEGLLRCSTLPLIRE